MLDTKWVREHYDDLAEMLASRINAFRWTVIRSWTRNAARSSSRLKSSERRNAGSKVGVRKRPARIPRRCRRDPRARRRDKGFRRQRTIQPNLTSWPRIEPSARERAEGQGRERQYRDAPWGRANSTSRRNRQAGEALAS
ncbi:MAG: hypothetical protein ACLUEQ_07975 [Cloacibacillus evryensis]